MTRGALLSNHRWIDLAVAKRERKARIQLENSKRTAATSVWSTPIVVTLLRVQGAATKRWPTFGGAFQFYSRPNVVTRYLPLV